MSILIFSEKTSPRLNYVLDVLFKEWWQSSYILCHDPDEFESNGGPKLSYGRSFRPDIPSIPDAGLLFREDVEEIVPGFRQIGERPAFFPVEEEGYTWSFDLLSLTFFHLTRYEEYDSESRDKFGRFVSKDSVFAGYHHRPLVDEWHNALGELLRSRYKDLALDRIPFNKVCSYDIDMMRAYALRPMKENILGLGKQIVTGRWKYIAERIGVMTGKRKDPYDLFGQLREQHRGKQASIRYFVLMGDYGRLDKAVGVQSGSFRHLLNRLDDYAGVGLHSSVRASRDQKLLEEEKYSLERILGRPVRSNRQHYLHFRIPDQYPRYAKAGILEEWSMGYANETGFRAGTSRRYSWFDLAANKKRGMQIVPFQVMDVTMRYYQEWTPEQALEEVSRLEETVREHGGQFCSIWHNSSFHRKAGWGPWQKVHDAMLG